MIHTPPNQRERGVTTTTIVTIGLVIVAIIVIAALVMRNGNNTTDLNTNDTTLFNDNETATTAERDADQLEQIDDETSPTSTGQQVTIQGEVATTYSNRVLSLAEAGADVVEAEVLVISRTPLPVQLLEDDNDVVDEEEIVSVTGTLQVLSIAEIEAELGLDLNPEIEAALEENEPFILADSVTIVSENTLDTQVQQ